MTEKDKNRTTIEAYDKNPQYYAEKFDSYGARIEDVDRALKLNESGSNKVLELGCGNGRDAEYIISVVGSDNYIGIDASKGLLDLAKKKNPQGEFHVKDMRDVSLQKGGQAYETETFGVIFSFASMLHLPAGGGRQAGVNSIGVAEIVERCHKWLKIGGILYISTKCGDYKEELTKNLGDEKYYYSYKPEDIEKLCPYKFFVVYKNIQDIKRQSWFEMALRKIGGE